MYDIEVFKGIFEFYLNPAQVEGLAKPDPAMFRKALEITGSDPAHMLYVGSIALITTS